MIDFKDKKKISRPNFMAIAGGAAGVAAMAALGVSAGSGECRANIPEIDVDKIVSTEYETDVLVVGSGMAGLFAVVKAHDAGASVLMVSKGRLGASGMTLLPGVSLPMIQPRPPWIWNSLSRGYPALPWKPIILFSQGRWRLTPWKG